MDQSQDLLISPSLYDNLGEKDDSQTQNKLSTEIQNYMDAHAVTKNVSSTYTLGAVTLQRDQNRVVVFQSKIQPQGAYLRYNLYASQKFAEHKEYIGVKEEDQVKSFFKVFERKNIGSNLNLINKRYFETCYAYSKPQFSASQNMCFFPDFTGNENRIDVFDSKNDNFFLGKEIVARQSNDSFMCSLAVSEECADEFIKVITCQGNDQVVAVLGRRAVHIFDLGKIGEKDSQGFLNPSLTYTLNNKIYDYILDIGLNGIDYNESWITFISKEFYFAQLIKLKDLTKDREPSKQGSSGLIKSNAKILGGSFIQSKEEIRVQFKLDVGKEFWSGLSISFTEDGSKAYLKSPTTKYLIKFTFKPGAKSVAKVKEDWEHQDLEVTVVPWNLNDFLIIEINKSKQKMQFSNLETKQQNNIHSNIKIEHTGLTEIVEALQFKRGTQKVFRLTTIKETSELQSFEADSQGDIYKRTVNSLAQTSIRWPFYAQVISPQKIHINLLTQYAITVRFTHQFSQNEAIGQITKMGFSNLGNLIYQVSTDKEVIFYKLQVKRDLSDERGRIPGENNQRPISILDDKQTLDLMKDTDSDIDGNLGIIAELPQSMEYVEEIFRMPKGRATKKMSVFEEQLSEFKTNLFIILQINVGTHVIVKKENQPAKMTTLPYKTDTFVSLQGNIYAVKLDQEDSVAQVTVNFHKNKGYKSMIVMQEFNGKILNINGDKKKLYTLVKEEGKFFFKVYVAKGNDFNFLSSIPLDSSNDEFMQIFRSDPIMTEDILIHSDQKFTRIYDHQAGHKACLQEYEDFLPEREDESRVLINSGIRICPRYDRVLMLLSFPSSLRPRKIITTPYFTNRNVDVQTPQVKQACWIDAASNAANLLDRKSDAYMIYQDHPAIIKKIENYVRKQKTSIYSWIPEKWTLVESNLAGETLKKSDFSSIFKDNIILCVDEQAARYLVTPIGNTYLNEFRILEISNEHYVNENISIMADKIKVRPMGSKNELSLYEYIANLKTVQQCSLEFQICKNNIAMGARTLDKKIFDVILIQPQIAELGESDTLCVDFSKHELMSCTARCVRADGKAQAKESDEYDSWYSDIFQWTDESESTTKINKDLLQSKRKALHQKRRSMLSQARKFKLSATHVFLWSKTQILSHKLETEQTENYIQLRPISFTISETLKKASLDKDAVMDKIKSIHTPIGLFQKEEWIQILVKLAGGTLLHIVYNLKKDREVAWHQGTANLQLLYTNHGMAYLYEQEVGIFSATDKHTAMWFQVYDQNEHLLNKDRQAYGMSWKNRIYNVGMKSYLIGASTMILPYSLQNIVQRYRSQSYEANLEDFYASDMYMLDGNIHMHKFRTSPVQLEMMLEDYWVQKPFALLQTLIKEAKLSVHNGEQQSQHKAKLDRLASGSSSIVVNEKLKVTNAVVPMVKHVDSEIISRLELGNDTLQDQIDQSGDKLVNKILYYLSELPIQFSMFQVTQKLDEMVTFVRIQDYLNKSFEMTDQMKSIQVLRTDLPAGDQQLTTNVSYLGERFFKEFTELSSTPIEKQGFKLVQMDFMRISWLTDDTDSRKFLTALVNDGPISLFQNENIVQIVDYLWGIGRPFFIVYGFLPFMYLTLIPTILVPITQDFIIREDKSISYGNLVTHLLFLFLMTIGNIRNLYWEVKEIVKKRHNYLLNPNNYFQIFLVVSQLILAFFIYRTNINRIYGIVLRKREQTPENIQQIQDLLDVRESDASKVTIWATITLLLLLIELPNQLRIFDFFSPFVRALEETFIDSGQIMTLFAIIVFFQGIMIWTLDAGNVYPGVIGIGQTFVMSYFMALGDFGVTEAFEESQYQWLFWIIFFFLTFVSLLIILNMVIAIMSASFERVQEENDAHIMRGRIQVILTFWFRLPDAYKKKFTSAKYLVHISIDPSSDSVINQDFESRIRDDIAKLDKMQRKIEYQQDKTNFNVNSLHQRFGKVEKNIQSLMNHHKIKKN